MSIIVPFMTSVSPFPSFLCISSLSGLSFSLSGSGGNSHSSTQMNSYSDSGYQDTSSGYLSSQNMGKAELRMQHSFPGVCTGTLVRNTRAEGQASAQVLLKGLIQHIAVAAKRTMYLRRAVFLKIATCTTLPFFKIRSHSSQQLVGNTSTGGGVKLLLHVFL